MSAAAAAAADPAALLDMGAAAERAAAGAAASSSSSAPPSSRYARRASVPRHALPLDLLLAPQPSQADLLRAEASPASCARARRDASVAPWREAGLMMQAAAIPLAIFAYGLAQNDRFCKGDWDRYWSDVPRVRLPELRVRSQFGVLQGGRKVLMAEVDHFLRATTRWIGRTPPGLRSRPKGPPGGATPPVPPPRDW